MRLLIPAVLAVSALLSGCMTITASKSMVVEPQPGETKIPVTANAVTHCRHYVVIYRCTLNVDIERAK
jgi:hypothetical protein